MKSTYRRNRGLTLIELLIVVAILGILAGIVIPRFTGASQTAKASALASQMNTINKSLVRYRADHNDNNPTDEQLITNQWQALTQTTDINGDAAGDVYGPYFQKPPNNPYRDSSIVADDNAEAWLYDSSAGTVQGVVPQSVYDDANKLQLAPANLVVEP